MTTGHIACEDVTLVRDPGAANESTILTGLSARFDRGRVSLVTGPVGAGKTSLLYLLAGILRPTAGVVLADGQPMSRFVAPKRDLHRQRVGIVFQRSFFFDDESVLENVVLPLVPRSKNTTAILAAGRATLEQVGLSHLAGTPIAALSEGQRQRVDLARAQVGNPAFFLLDEPTAHQDTQGLDIVAASIERRRAEDAVVVVATHDARLIDRGVADAVWRLESGRLERRT